MLIVGDFSGIQEYLFDVAHEGGGQARRLRARSFFIQLLAECAALRVIRAAEWTQDQTIFCGAGKFILEGPALTEPQRAALEAERTRIGQWLLESTGAQLRFALAIGDDAPQPREQFQRVMKSLQKAKLTAWSDVVTQDAKWQTAELVLDPLDTPCALCRRRTAEMDEVSGDTTRKVCLRCYEDREVGRLLPGTRWVALSEVSLFEGSQILGFDLSLQKEPPNTGDFLIFIDAPPAPAVANVNKDCVIARQLARHIPVNRDNSPMDFGEIAGRASGDQLLGVLKADADSLGEIIDQVLKEAKDLSPLAGLSRELDEFFAGTLTRELNKSEWNFIYTIFAGGDDLILVGPWNIIVDFAGHVHDLFQKKFGERRMTLSAGVSFVKPKRPIKFAAEQADHLLEFAKTKTAPNATTLKDQLAAFGQMWKWRDHGAIINAGKRLAQWAKDGTAERGWIHTLLELALSRQNGELRATSRLAYHVARNYPKVNDRDPAGAELRKWANQLIVDLDEFQTTETIYLPAIARYALTATRSSREES